MAQLHGDHSRSSHPHDSRDRDRDHHHSSSSSAFATYRRDGRGSRDDHHSRHSDSHRPSTSRGFGTSRGFSRGRYDSDPSGPSIAVLGLDPTSLPPIAKNFYSESADITAMSLQDMEAFRTTHEMSIQGRDVPRPIVHFGQAGFPQPIVQRLADDRFSAPTPIQAQGWPMALSGRNMVGIAQTGSGKTLSYVLPGLVHLMHQVPDADNSSASGSHSSGPRSYGHFHSYNTPRPKILVLAPTRELAVQIHEVARKYGSAMRVRSVVVFGGAPKSMQMRELRGGVDVLIATPGRLIDLLRDRALVLDRVSYLVLDEADRMLDMGFEPQLRDILPMVRSDRQVTMWSATWPRGVQKLARDLLGSDFIQVTIGSQELTANKRIRQTVRLLPSSYDKDPALAQLLDELWKAIPGSEDAKQMVRTIVFCNTKRHCDRLAGEMTANGWPAAAMHGDLTQGQRDAVLRDFKSGRRPIFVCTDVAARGLDVKDVRVVVNYDFPKNFEDYIHRIGRTARGLETDGSAYAFFVASENRGCARDLVKLLREALQPVPEDLEKLAFPTGGRGAYGQSYGGGGGGRSAFSRSQENFSSRNSNSYQQY